MWDFFQNVSAEILATSIICFGSFMLARQAKQKKEMAALKLGIQAMLRDRIIQGYNHYTGKGWIPIYAKEGLFACYESYEQLGQNGVINDLMAQIRALPNQEPGQHD